ncbi:MAG: very short patch repair endonuclease [Terriglobia bacterium]
MRLVRSKDTKPELVVRKLLYRLGFRFRIHASYLPGKPDVILTRAKLAIFVHGCFWHRHRKGCRLTRLPKSRLEYWRPKLERNRARDTLNRRKLRRLGWRVAVIWECQISDRDWLERRLKDLAALD